MKVYQVTYLFILFSIFSCSGKNMGTDSKTDEQEANETFEYVLKDSSIMKVPYNGKSEVIFVDSLSNELIFAIEENEVETEDFSNYNIELEKCEPPNWTEQHKEFQLINDSLDLTFILELKTELDHNGSPHPKKYRDMLFLWTVYHPNNEETENDSEIILETRNSLFQCVVDERNSVYSSQWQPSDSLTIWGRTFYEVLGEDIDESESKHSILFNFEYGVLSFQDYQRNIWRFSHFSK